MRRIGKGLLRGLALAMVIAPLATVYAASSVSGIGHAATADGSVEITLQTSGDTPQVNVFATESPPRIVLDLADTDSSASSAPVNVGMGTVQRYEAISAGGRTRLVVDLSSASAYDYSAAAGKVVLTVAAGANADASAARTSVIRAHSTSRSAAARVRVAAIRAAPTSRISRSRNASSISAHVTASASPVGRGSSSARNVPPYRPRRDTR